MPKIAEFSWEALEYSTGGSGGTGGTGTPGSAATIKVGTVVSGDTASVTNVGTSNDAVFNFVLPKGVDADTSVIKSLQSDVQNVQNTLKSVDKYSEYEERYVAFSASELPANSVLKQITFQRTFSTIPFVQITLDIQDATVRVPYYANVTTTGFQVGSNYGSSVKGVWYKAYVK